MQTGDTPFSLKLAMRLRLGLPDHRVFSEHQYFLFDAPADDSVWNRVDQFLVTRVNTRHLLLKLRNTPLQILLLQFVDLGYAIAFALGGHLAEVSLESE